MSNFSKQQKIALIGLVVAILLVAGTMAVIYLFHQKVINTLSLNLATKVNDSQYAIKPNGHIMQSLIIYVCCYKDESPNARILFMKTFDVFVYNINFEVMNQKTIHNGNISWDASLTMNKTDVLVTLNGLPLDSHAKVLFNKKLLLQ